MTNVLDTIEQHFTTDVMLAQAVVDALEVVAYTELDGGRRISLVRLGMAVDAVSRQLGADVMVYPVVDRNLLSDAELTSKERMALGRWAGDGLVEVATGGTGRVIEVAQLTGLPAVARPKPAPVPIWGLVPAGGGALVQVPPGPPPEPQGGPLLARRWTCKEPGCPSFGPQRPGGPSVPRLRGGTPSCPRHDTPLYDAGPRPPGVPVRVSVAGVARRRFAVVAGRPVTIGRSPDGPDAVMLGPWLDERAVTAVSRNHARLDLHDGTLYVTDLSTNGTVVLSRPGRDAGPARVGLRRDQPYALGEWDTVELFPGVELGRGDRLAAPSGDTSTSVLGDAPTVAMRLPKMNG